jgi:ABC-type glycerol-3-phosphate transport system substrate-binding protein
MKGTLSRRHLLKTSLFVTGGMLAACAPKVVTETVVVEKEVEKTVEVEKVVKEAVEVDKEVTRVVEVEVDRAAERAAAVAGNLIWDTFRGIGSGWNEERIESFQEMYPNVNIEFRPLVSSTQQENYGKMYAMHAAGDLGDICGFDPSHFHFVRAINADIIAPLDDLMDADGLDLDEWFPQFIEMQRFQGNIYGLPSWGWSGQDAFAINLLHFEELGIEPPEPTSYDTSMDTIGEWARRFYQAGAGPGEVERYGIACVTGEQSVPILRAFGGEFINAEGTQSLVLEDGARQALKWMYDLYVTDRVAPAAGDLAGGAQAGWAEGRLTMSNVGSLSSINHGKAIQDASKAKLGNMLFPLYNGNVPSQIRGGTWNVNTRSNHPEAAYLFVKHIAGKDGTIGFNLVGNNGALTRPDVLPILRGANPVYGWFINNLQNGMAIHAPANSRGREFTDAAAQWHVRMLDPRDVVPFEQGLQDLHDNIQIVLDMPAP